MASACARLANAIWPATPRGAEGRLITYRDLVGGDAAVSVFDAYFLRSARVKVAQPKVSNLPCGAQREEMPYGSYVVSITVVLPEELRIISDVGAAHVPGGRRCPRGSN